MGEEVFFAVIAFAGVVVAGVVGLMWGDRRIEQRRAKFVEDGDWAGLFGPLGMAVDRGAEGRSGMRAVGLGGRLEVVLPRDTIAEVEEGMAMRFRLDMSAAVDPSLNMAGRRGDYDGEKQTYLGVQVEPHVRRGTQGELLDVKGDEVAALTLTVTGFAQHVLAFHTDVGGVMSEVSLRRGCSRSRRVMRPSSFVTEAWACSSGSWV